MPVTFIYRDLTNRVLKNALKKLGEHSSYREPKVRWSVEKLIRKWDQKARESSEVLTTDARKLAEIDEAGNLTIDPSHPSGLKLKDDKEKEFFEFMERFEKTEFTIEIDPLTREQIENVELSPVEMIALEKVMAPESKETPEAETKNDKEAAL